MTKMTIEELAGIYIVLTNTTDDKSVVEAKLRDVLVGLLEPSHECFGRPKRIGEED